LLFFFGIHRGDGCGGRRAATIYGLIVTPETNVDLASPSRGCRIHLLPGLIRIERVNTLCDDRVRRP
jgi:hypothetical protein